MNQSHYLYTKNHLTHDSESFIYYYTPENFYNQRNNRLVTRRKHMKLSLQMRAFVYDAVRDDIMIGFHSSIKQSLQTRTLLFQLMGSYKNQRTLTPFARARKKIFFYYNHFRYLTLDYLRYRTLLLKRRRKHYSILSLILQVRPHNRKLFFSLITRLSRLSFKLPGYIITFRRRRRFAYYYYLGFKIILKNYLFLRLFSGLFGHSTHKSKYERIIKHIYNTPRKRRRRRFSFLRRRRNTFFRIYRKLHYFRVRRTYFRIAVKPLLFRTRFIVRSLRIKKRFFCKYSRPNKRIEYNTIRKYYIQSSHRRSNICARLKNLEKLRKQGNPFIENKRNYNDKK